MTPHTHIEINFKALENNIKFIKEKAGNKKIQGVVKANAYGHGDFEIARALEKLGVTSLGVARVNEGVRLRELGITSEILVLGGADETEFEPLINHKLKPVIYNEGIAEKLNDYLKFRDLRHPVHIKIDTGMHRLGINYDQTEKFFKDLKGYSNLEPEGIMSHFVAAGSKEAEWNALQTDRFKLALANWKKILKEDPKNIHIENSAGFFNFNMDFTNTVRLGIAIYGYGSPGLLPVLRLYSAVKDIKAVKKGETVSYGGWFRAQSDMKIAVVPVGYGDGFMRSGRKGSVVVNGVEAPIVSIICMDYFMVDISHIDKVNIGDQVTIIGDTHDAGYWAKTSGTIVYEVLTLLNPRIRRKYNGS
jgi:alanine racemase